MDNFIKCLKIRFSMLFSRSFRGRTKAHKNCALVNILIIVLIFFFYGCSNGVPDVVRTDCTVVFSYNGPFVDSRLSVFLQSESDVRRCERIKVRSIDAKYMWETDDIKKIAMGSFQWAGNSNFVVPEGEEIPQGRYEITYINADEESQISYADVKYDKNLYSMSSDSVASWMYNRGALNYAIFDSSNVLLFFGEPSEDFFSTGDILDRYNSASYYRDVWVTYDNSVICILPKKQL